MAHKDDHDESSIDAEADSDVSVISVTEKRILLIVMVETAVESRKNLQKIHACLQVIGEGLDGCR